MRIFLLLALLAAAFLLYSLMKIKNAPSVVPPRTPGIKDTLLYRHVEHLTATIGSRSVFEYDRIIAARDYILSCLNGMGYSPARQDFSYQGRTFSNIVVSLRGAARPGDVVLIGAHYDTMVGTPGADDNASAVAMLLEMCRLLKNYAPGMTLKLVFFALEEPPLFRTEFMGSAIYAREAKKQGENIRGMISLEMLGYYSDQKGGQSYPFPLMHLMYPSTPNFIAVVGNLSSRRLVHRIADSLREKAGIPVETLATVSFLPGVDFSDHRSFWEVGYPAVMITDTAFYRNPNYHRETDRIDTLDFLRMSALLQGLVQTAKDLTAP
ncbi:MAG: M28 family peptidase [Deltaproteobacteria bacterium]|nr:M28 family peptidase [Deltaproteobacteria bacterium]